MSDEQGRPGQAAGVGRRAFWRNLAGAVVAMRDELHGIAQQSLREIGGVPDSVLAEMVPVWMDGRPVEIRDDGIYLAGATGRDGVTLPPRLVHSFGAWERIMADQYGCGRNLRAIAEHTAQAAAMDTATAFTATRALFVKLCERGLCHPAAAHVVNRGGKP